ncbi:OB-fold nucleic acid binding domain-containing protein [Chitinophaga sedimenti]|nr:OB-fold nucleic acid binding domain-containing protein [Chitinophaga sedimenti]
MRKEVGIFTFRDLLEYFPFRYVDRTRVTKITSLHMQLDYVQVKGRIVHMEVMGDKRAKRLVARLQDDTGTLDLVWFQGWQWMQKSLREGVQYLVFGKIAVFNGNLQMSHPEMDLLTENIADGKRHRSRCIPLPKN